MELDQVVALAKAHPTLVVDKGNMNRYFPVAAFKCPTAAALAALDALRHAPCTCGCEDGEPCSATIFAID
jgi:hypothetical protein